MNIFLWIVATPTIPTTALEIAKTNPELWSNSTYVLIVLASILTGAAVKIYDRWKKTADAGDERLDTHIEARIEDLKERITALESQNEILRVENRKLTVIAVQRKKQREMLK